jgi:hypothetical protein
LVFSETLCHIQHGLLYADRFPAESLLRLGIIDLILFRLLSLGLSFRGVGETVEEGRRCFLEEKIEERLVRRVG